MSGTDNRRGIEGRALTGRVITGREFGRRSITTGGKPGSSVGSSSPNALLVWFDGLPSDALGNNAQPTGGQKVWSDGLPIGSIT